MSQHDMDVANGAGVVVRADINAALQALASLSSGASAPSPSFPCQLWADTGASRLKRRNAANSAWIDEGPLDAALRDAASQGEFVADTGAANAYVCNFVPAITARSESTPLRFKVANANTTASTINDGVGVVALVGAAHAALQGGELTANGIAWIQWNASVGGGSYVLLFCTGAPEQVANATKSQHAVPLAQLGSVTPSKIQPIASSVASNALTLTLNPTTLDIRSATLSSGTVNTRIISSAISMVVPSGATLGTGNAIAARLVVLALDNAGAIELAVANLAGGVNLDEATLISTTAISAGAAAASVIYSTTARTSVPFRVVGFVDSTQATAGTWATAPSTIQGAGGQALAALSSIGFGQAWQNVTGSRAQGTTYTNSTGRPIQVSVTGASAAGSQNMVCTVNGVAVIMGVAVVNASIANGQIIIPAGATFAISGMSSISSWWELR